MTEYLRLPNDLKARIEQAAQAHGKTAEQFAVDVLEQHVPTPIELTSVPPLLAALSQPYQESPREREQSLTEMLSEWHVEDEEMTPQEAALNAETLRQIDLNRCSPRKLFEKYLPH